jgi:hypothetical protein
LDARTPARERDRAGPRSGLRSDARLVLCCQAKSPTVVWSVERDG